MKVEDLKALREEGPFITKWEYEDVPLDTYLAWVNHEGKMCTHFLSCKDYVHDVLNAAINGVDFGTVSYRHKVLPMDLDITRLAVGFGPDNDKAYEKVLRVLSLIHAIERDQGFSRTKVRFGGAFDCKKTVYYKDTKENYVTWVFEADRRWMHASPLISFYCMCVRMGFDYDGSDWREFLKNGKITTSVRDRGYCNDSNGFWNKLIGRPISETFGRLREKNYPLGFVTHEKGFRWMARMNGVPAAVSHWKDLKKTE